jgi:UDP-2,3-diacylglucosamine pyrophosphatase LpxH
MGKVIILGDTHFPYHSKAALTEVLAVIKRDAENISHIVQIGDLFDFFSLSRFPRSQDLATPIDEVSLGFECATEMWAHIRKVAPKAKCIQILGNHDIRLKLRIKEKLPEILNIVKFDHLWKFPGVTTVMDEREEFIINDVAYMHGFYSKIGQHCRHNMMNTVHGHTHRGGVMFTKVQEKPIWELDVGFLGDPHSKVMNYTKQRWGVWTLGYGVIDELGPRFVPISGKKKKSSIIQLFGKRKKNALSR